MRLAENVEVLACFDPQRPRLIFGVTCWECDVCHSHNPSLFVSLPLRAGGDNPCSDKRKRDMTNEMRELNLDELHEASGGAGVEVRAASRTGNYRLYGVAPRYFRLDQLHQAASR